MILGGGHLVHYALPEAMTKIRLPLHHHERLDEYVWPKKVVQLIGDLNQGMPMQSKKHRYYIIES
jgi:hypothetical protein